MTGAETADGTATTADGRSGYATLLLLAGGCLVSASLSAYEIVPASVTLLIRESLGIGPASAGLVVSVMFGTAVVASLPVGMALDRTNSRTAIALAVLALFGAGVWGWVAASQGAYWSLLGSRVVGGLAYVVVWNAGIDIVSLSVGPSRRATAVGVFTASGPVGFALGQSTGPLVAQAWGWPAIFLVYNGLAVVGLALFWPTSRGLGRTVGGAPTLSEFGGVLRDRAVWLVGLIGFLGYSLYLFVNSWAPSYLAEELSLSLGLSGLLVAVFPAVGVLSRATSGALSDRLFDGRRRPVVLGSFLVTTPLVTGFTFVDSVGVLVGVLLVAGFAVQLSIGLSYAYVRELVDSRVAATAVAFQTSIGLAGAFVAPIAGGALIRTFGYRAAFLAAGALAVVALALAYRAPEPG